MPPDYLTAHPSQMADAVRAVLAGDDLHATAVGLSMETADLEDAVCAYHAAGAAALAHRADRWHSVRVRFSDWNSSERTMAIVLAPALDQITTSATPLRWWFLRKHPHWRIRLLDGHAATISRLLDDLASSGTIADWQPALYEPEITAFGGPSGMDIAHELSCADSRSTLEYARCDTPPVGRRELSILLINAMMTAAGLDWFERGDVFGRIAGMRPGPSEGEADRTAQLIVQLRSLLTVPVRSILADSGTGRVAQPWLCAFEKAGRRFRDSADLCLLTRGTRAILAQTVIFHWNRVGLSATTQGILARAATAVYLP
jgi:thiopeptide-type bacteriocin biosynthesis protein